MSGVCLSSSRTQSLFSYASNSNSNKPPQPSNTCRFSQPETLLSRTFNIRVSRTKIFCAKSADSEPDDYSPAAPAQLSRESVSVSSSSSGGSNSSTALLSFLCPLLKLFSIEDPSGERNYTFEVLTSSLSSLVRLPWGSKSISSGTEVATLDPPIRLQLFEFEACPFCRRVREAITELDLSVEVYPCPKGSLRHREMVRTFGGKEQFPYLVDPNTGVSMYESGDIVNYLFKQYGRGRKPSAGLLESTLVTGWMPTILRAGRGMTLWEKATQDPPPKKLELFSYENNPYSRIVREALCELELPYVVQNVGEGSSRSKFLDNVAGSKEVPFLIDPNTGTEVGDYKKIISYLFHTYSKKSSEVSSSLG